MTAVNDATDHAHTVSAAVESMAKELADKSGVMPKLASEYSRDLCYAEDVREAIAGMQLRIEAAEKSSALVSSFCDKLRLNTSAEIHGYIESNEALRQELEAANGKLGQVTNEREHYRIERDALQAKLTAVKKWADSWAAIPYEDAWKHAAKEVGEILAAGAEHKEQA